MTRRPPSSSWLRPGRPRAGATSLVSTRAEHPKRRPECSGTSARALACFSHETVVESCCPSPGEELDIESLLLDNGTLYLLGKASRLGAIAPLITALADEVFECAETVAVRMASRRLDPPLLGLLDEVPSIAPVPALPELLADGRGRGIVIVYAMQSFSQAITRSGRPKSRDDEQRHHYYRRARGDHVTK